MEAEIAESKVEEQGGGKEYTLTMSDAYAEKIKAKNVNELQQNIDEMEQNNEEDMVIEEVETKLQEIEETNYQDITITYEINKEDFMTAVHYESTVMPPTGETYTLSTSFALTEYNLSDTGDLLPKIAE